MPSDLKSTLDVVSSVSASWLITFLLHSTLILGLTWLLTRYLRSYQLKDTLWKAALIGSLLSASLHVFCGPPLLVKSVVFPPVEMTTSRLPVADEAEPFNPATDSGGNVEQTGVFNRVGAIVSGSMDRLSQILDGRTNWIGLHTAHLLRNGSGWIVSIWLACAATLGMLYTLSRKKYLSGLGQRHDVPMGVLTITLAQLCRKAGLDHCPRLTWSSNCARPLVLDRGEICLPKQAFTRLTAEQQKGMLAHELAHVVRHDPFWLQLSNVLERLLFFQPLVRMARHRMQECAEYLCDAQSARYLGGGLELAECLVEVAGWPLESRPAVAAGMANGSADLESRVFRLVDGSWVERPAGKRWWWTGVALVLFTLIGWAGPGVSVLAEQKTPAPVVVMSSPEMTQATITPVVTPVPATPVPDANAAVQLDLDEVPNPAQATPQAPAISARLIWPVEGKITRPYSGEHQALDIAALEGSPVLAVETGRVVFKGWDDQGFGNVLLIEHPDGLYSFYSHLLEYQVEDGQAVHAGQVIGSVGNTGQSTGPHLHFELTKDGEKVNPQLFLPVGN